MIANGQLIEEYDLYSLQGTSNTLKTADGVLPGCWQLAVSFPGVVASTPSYRREIVFVSPGDVLLETIAVATGVQTSGSACTVTLSSDGGPLASYPAAVSGATSTGLSRIARVLYDNSPTNLADNPALTARVGRTLGKGQTITLTVETTNVNAAGVVNITLFGRRFHSRS